DLLPRGLLGEAREHPWETSMWAALLAAGLVVVVPTALVIVRATRVYRFEDAGGNFWASQFRLLLPFFPGFHPDSPPLRAVFGEAAGVAEFSTGWALLAAACLGVYGAARRRALLPFVPILVTFALFFAFHPQRFPTLHVFPWFFYNRVAGRSTIFFPL